MKTLIFVAVLAAVCLTARAQDVSAKAVRYRNGSTLSFDSSASIKDEDSAWTLTKTQMGKLSVLQFGSTLNGTSTTKTQAFTTAFSSAPIVTLSAGTNDLAHIVTITTTNVVFGAAQTNATIRWIAIGSP